MFAPTRTFPQFGITINNDSLAEKNFNDATTYGARARASRRPQRQLDGHARRSWRRRPRRAGSSAANPALGEYKVAHFSPDDSEDQWANAALTLEGKISNFDLTYAGRS